jgi:hypothetical protein
MLSQEYQNEMFFERRTQKKEIKRETFSCFVWFLWSSSMAKYNVGDKIFAYNSSLFYEAKVV